MPFSCWCCCSGRKAFCGEHREIRRAQISVQPDLLAGFCRGGDDAAVAVALLSRGRDHRAVLYRARAGVEYRRRHRRPDVARAQRFRRRRRIALQRAAAQARHQHVARHGDRSRDLGSTWRIHRLGGFPFSSQPSVIRADHVGVRGDGSARSRRLGIPGRRVGAFSAAGSRLAAEFRIRRPTRQLLSAVHREPCLPDRQSGDFEHAAGLLPAGDARQRKRRPGHRARPLPR